MPLESVPGFDVASSYEVRELGEPTFQMVIDHKRDEKCPKGPKRGNHLKKNIHQNPPLGANGVIPDDFGPTSIPPYRAERGGATSIVNLWKKV